MIYVKSDTGQTDLATLEPNNAEMILAQTCSIHGFEITAMTLMNQGKQYLNPHDQINDGEVVYLCPTKTRLEFTCLVKYGDNTLEIPFCDNLFNDACARFGINPETHKLNDGENDCDFSICENVYRIKYGDRELRVPFEDKEDMLEKLCGQLGLDPKLHKLVDTTAYDYTLVEIEAPKKRATLGFVHVELEDGRSVSVPIKHENPLKLAVLIEACNLLGLGDTNYDFGSTMDTVSEGDTIMLKRK